MANTRTRPCLTQNSAPARWMFLACMRPAASAPITRISSAPLSCSALFARLAKPAENHEISLFRSKFLDIIAAQANLHGGHPHGIEPTKTGYIARQSAGGFWRDVSLCPGSNWRQTRFV